MQLVSNVCESTWRKSAIQKIQPVVCLSFFCLCVCRLRLEALTDKEPAQLDIDSEEEEKKESQGGVEEGLPASQPQPTTTQVLLEEEDLIIEDYNSDWHTTLPYIHCHTVTQVNFFVVCIILQLSFGLVWRKISTTWNRQTSSEIHFW